MLVNIVRYNVGYYRLKDIAIITIGLVCIVSIPNIVCIVSTILSNT